MIFLFQGKDRFFLAPEGASSLKVLTPANYPYPTGSLSLLGFYAYLPRTEGFLDCTFSSIRRR